MPLGPLEQAQAPIFIKANAAPEEIGIAPKIAEYKSWMRVLNTTEGQQTNVEFISGAETRAPPRSVLASCGLGMNARQPGPELTTGGARQLCAGGEARRSAELGKSHTPTRGEDGWFSAEIPGATVAGTRYKFRIDDEIDVPDPGFRLQPEDVSGPSELIDHAAYQWRATDWRGRPWHEAVVLEAHVGTFTREGTLSRHDRQARSSADTGITSRWN